MASPPPYPPINAEPRSVIAAMVETGHEAHAEALAGAILVLPSLGRDQVKGALSRVIPSAIPHVLEALERSMGSPSLPSLHLFSEPDVLGVASGLGPDVLAAVATAMIDKKYATIDHIRAALCSTSVPPLTVFHLQDMLEQSLLTRVFALLREVDSPLSFNESSARAVGRAVKQGSGVSRFAMFGRKSWKERHFELDIVTGVLSYSKGPGKPPKGTVVLWGAGIESASFGPSRPFGVSVDTPARTLLLSLGSHTAHAAWLSLLAVCASKRNSLRLVDRLRALQSTPVIQTSTPAAHSPHSARIALPTSSSPTTSFVHPTLSCGVGSPFLSAPLPPPVLSPAEQAKHAQLAKQVHTFVDFFAAEFMSELWYRDEASRGNIATRASTEVNYKQLYHLAVGLASVIPIPGAAAAFIASCEIISTVKDLHEQLVSLDAYQTATSWLSGAWAVYVRGKQLVTEAKELRGSGGEDHTDRLVSSSSPLDIEAMKPLARRVGALIARRYEFVLVERLSTVPEDGLILFARIAARRCLAYLASQSEVPKDALEQVAHMLEGVSIQQPTLWFQRPLVWLKAKNVLKCQDPTISLTVEAVLPGHLWYTDGEPLAIVQSKAVSGGNWQTCGFTLGECPTGAALSPQLHIPVAMDALRVWRSKRVYQLVTVSDVRAYVLTINASSRIPFRTFLRQRYPSHHYSWTRPTLQLSASDGVCLAGGDFSGCDLSGSVVVGDITGAVFEGCILFGVAFDGCTASSPLSFVSAELSYSSFIGATFDCEVNFTQANCTCMNLSSARFGGLIHIGAILYKANLSEFTCTSAGDLVNSLRAASVEQYEQLLATQEVERAARTALEKRMDALSDQLKGLGSMLPEERGQFEELVAQQRDRLLFEAACEDRLGQLERRSVEEAEAWRANLASLRAEIDAVNTEIACRLSALEARIAQTESCVGAIVTRLDALEALKAELTKLASGVTDFDRALSKLLHQFLAQLDHRESELHYYIRPDVVVDLPGNTTLGEYVLKLETGESDAVDSKMLLVDSDEFLASGDQLMLLLGEPGSGKSLYTWFSARSKMADYHGFVESAAQAGAGAIDASRLPWIPVAIDLKNYSLSEVHGLLPRYLRQQCGLSEDEVNSIRLDVGDRHIKLLVYCDGFDELKAERGGAVETAATRNAFQNFIEGLCGGQPWSTSVLKVVVTCRDRHLNGRSEESRMFGGNYRRRLLLPFRSTQIDQYLHERTSSATEVGLLCASEYVFVMNQSPSVKELVRNPFVLRLFVDALPGMKAGGHDLTSLTKYSIYEGFVRSWFAKEVKRRFNLGDGVLDSASVTIADGLDDTVDDVIGKFELLAAIVAGEMFKQNTLTLAFSDANGEECESGSVWASVQLAADDWLNDDLAAERVRLVAKYSKLSPPQLRALRSEGVTDGESYATRALSGQYRVLDTSIQLFQSTCPLRRLGDCYSFIHKSFYEYFLARLVLLSSGSKQSPDVRVRRCVSVLNSGSRRWQSEPEAIYFLCDKWWSSSLMVPESLEVTAARQTLIAVIENSARDSSIATASANAATLLNWANESFSGVQWDGVQLGGADLSYAVFLGTSLRGANLSGSKLKRVVLNRADVTGANLEGVNFAERAPVSLECATGDVSMLLAVCAPLPYFVGLIDGVVKIWTSTGAFWVCLYGNSPLRYVAAVGGIVGGVCEDGSTVGWETVNYQRVWCTSLGAVPVTTIALGQREDRTLACTGHADGSISVWFVSDLSLVFSTTMSPSAACSAVCFDDTCSTVAVGCESGTIRILRVPPAHNQAPLVTISGDAHAITALALSSSVVGFQLVAACVRGSSSVNVWKCCTGELLHTLSGHTGHVTCLAFSPPVQGRPVFLSTGSADNDCLLWDVTSGQQFGPALQGHAGPVLSVQFETGEHGMVVSTGADKCARFWDIDSANANRERLHVSGTLMSIRGNAEGTGFVSVGESGEIFDWEVIRRVDGSGCSLTPRWIQRVDILSSAAQAGSVISVGEVDRSNIPTIARVGSGAAVRLWCNGSNTLLGPASLPVMKVCCVDSVMVAIAGTDGIVQLWSTAGVPVKTLQAADGDVVLDLVCSPGASPLLARRNSTSIRCWDLGADNAEPLYTLKWAAPCAALCFGPPGRAQLFAVSTRNRIELRDARSGCACRSLCDHSGDIAAMCWLSPSQVATGAADCTVRVWDVDSGLVSQSISCPSTPKELLALPLADLLVALCKDGVLRVWDGATGYLVAQSRSHVAGPFASEVYGLGLASTNDYRLLESTGFDSGFDSVHSAVILPRGVTPANPQELSQALSYQLSVPARDALKRSFLRHMRLHGITDGLDVRLLRVVEMSKAGSYHALSAGNAASCLNWMCLSRQAPTLAGLDWSGVCLTGADLRSADLSRTRFEGAELIDCDFTDAGIPGADFSGVNLAESKVVRTVRILPGGLTCALSSPRLDGTALLASVVDDDLIQLWEPDTGKCVAMLKAHSGKVTGLSFVNRADGAFVLVSKCDDGTVQLWDVTAGDVPAASLLRVHDIIRAPAQSEAHVSCVPTAALALPTCLTFGTTSDGRLFLAGCADNTVWACEVSAEGGGFTVLKSSGQSNHVTCLSFGTRSDGVLILGCGNREKTIWLWDIDAGGEGVVLNGHSSVVESLSFHNGSDRRLLLASGSRDKTVRLWDAESGDAAAVVLRGHTDAVKCLCFGIRYDGRLLLASGSDDKSVRLWDVEGGGDPVAVLTGHSHPVTCLTFTIWRSGRLLLTSSSSGDNVVRLWDVEPLSLVLTSRRCGNRISKASAGPGLTPSAAQSDDLLSSSLGTGKPCLASGKYVSTIRLHDSRGNRGLAVSPDGTCLVVSNSSTHKVGVYALPGGTFWTEFGGEGSEPGRFNQPMRLCFSPLNIGIVIVSDRNNRRLQEMTLAGEHVRMIGVGVFDDGVFGVAAKASMIAVCTENGKVWVFDLCSGALIRSLGQKGGAEGQLEGCWGLRFTPDGDHMLIAEGHPNSRLSLFTLEVDLVRCIGVKTLGKPYDVDVASNGDILVADAANRRICVLSPKDYTLLRSFGSEGDAPGKFTYPTALAVHEERVFVLDWGSARVQVFN